MYTGGMKISPRAADRYIEWAEELCNPDWGDWLTRDDSGLNGSR